jgi:5-methyltetrahydrofolate--homocysteine methyltransferase
MGDMHPRLYESVLSGDAPGALSAAREALDAGTDPLCLIADGITPAMKEAGRLFEEGEYFVPDLLMSARATKGVFEMLRPLLATTGAQPAGRVVLGTVTGDMHDIGKNLVAVMLEGGGFEVTDLGVDVPPDRFVAAVERTGARIVGLSALLTTTLPAMKATLAAIRAANRPDVRILVGGAPVTAAYAKAIGADGYAETAAAAVEEARRLIAT